MPYVQRDNRGFIMGAFALPQPGFATEFVADTAPELIAFLNPPKLNITSANFFSLFTSAELTAITSLGQTNTDIKQFLSSIDRRGTFILTDPFIVSGINNIVTAGGLSLGRAEVILKGLKFT